MQRLLPVASGHFSLLYWLLAVKVPGIQLIGRLENVEQPRHATWHAVTAL